MFNRAIFSKSKPNYPKVICIGFNKSGTRSIHRLFEDNGIPSIHWDEGNLAKTCLLNIINGKKVLSGYDNKFRVFSDFMYRTGSFLFEGNSLFRQMSTDYPESYFVYNKRNIDDWIQSRIHHTNIVDGLNLLQLQKILLSTDSDSVAIEHWKKMRLLFENEIRVHFENNERFTEIDIYDPHFSEKISSHTKIPLDPIHWKKHGENSSKKPPDLKKP